MFKALYLAVALIAAPLAAGAAGTDIAFAGLKTDTTLPVQVSADQLSVSQVDGRAVFSGHVVVTQGTMTLQAESLQVEYAKDQKSIARMLAKGDVKLAAGAEAASAQTADYAPETGELILQGDVLLTQGGSTIAGQSLTISLKTGLGTMTGRVTTTFTPAQPKKN
jgi:lipopolysaccharide export system protein LptA